MATNYLLGYGQRLMTKLPPPGSEPHKWHPYKFEDAKKIVAARVQAVGEKANALPPKFRPNGEAVITLLLHPAYLAKSYFPSRLLAECRLRSVGSRASMKIPRVQKTSAKGKPELASALFVAGSSALIARLHETVEQWSDQSPAAEDVIKIEDVFLVDPASKIRLAPYQDKRTCTYWEIVLHATPLQDAVIESFRSLVNEVGGVADVDRRVYAGGLCFVPVRLGYVPLTEIAPFQFMRVARGMPRLRTIKRQIGSPLTFDCELPKSAALDQTINAVIFDGGPVDLQGLDKWVSNSEPVGIGAAVDDYRDHAIGVTSAALFGPIQKGEPLGQPYCNVEVVRVLDEKTPSEGPDYFDVYKRVVDEIKARNPDFANLSIGPDIPVDDDEPHLWTAGLDKLFFNDKLLPFLAVGNNGEMDWDSGNARVQAPSDCANGFALGSCNTLSENWQRSAHSSIGPSRTPGWVRPEALALGGDHNSPFFVLGPAEGTAVPVMGTSYASPTAMRVAAGVRACLGPIMRPLAIKALMINCADKRGERNIREVGWGRICHDVEKLITSDDSTVHVVYQNELTPGEWMRAPIPVPQGVLPGRLYMSATFCYKTETDPEHPINYTRAGLQLRFRPHEDRRDNEEDKRAKTKSLTSVRRITGQTEHEWRKKSFEWEPTIQVRYAANGTDIKAPAFEIHYNARRGGDNDKSAGRIPFALVVTIRSKKVKDLYNRVKSQYQMLEAIVPVHLPVKLPASEPSVRRPHRT